MTTREPVEHGPVVAAAIRAARSAIREASDRHKASDPPPRPEPEAGTEGTARVQPVREAIAAARQEET